MVASVVPGCRVEYAEDAGPDKRSYRVSFEKIARTWPSTNDSAVRSKLKCAVCAPENGKLTISA